MKRKLTDKEKELQIFELSIPKIIKDNKSKRKIIYAWKDYLNDLRYDYDFPDEWYKLTKDEKDYLYKTAGF